MAVRQPNIGWTRYLRVSSEDKQTPERSFAMQRQRIDEQLFANSGLPLIREYRDVLTGTTPNRADYQQMLSDAANGLFSHLALYRADRFGRDTVEGLEAATRLINLGVKIRVAHMPSLEPENPDGFFMFVLQMGLAQREVDVLRLRVADGVEAKIRAGGWAAKAPEGYLNKEEMIKSGKYNRWVEPDPEQCQSLREAWGLLLSGRCTLVQICEELTALGYTRPGGRPWAWTDPRTGERRHSDNRLHEIFHNAFYAGWVVSEKYGIAYGEIRGTWEPIISTEEYEQGLKILRANDAQKSRRKRYVYLLNNLAWVQCDADSHKLYGTTPSGRYKSYSYYMTRTRVHGSKLHIPCEVIDSQVEPWLLGVRVDPDLLPEIREVYRSQVAKVTEKDLSAKATELRRRMSQLREEEAKLARLYISGKMTEESYDQVRAEWLEKVRHAEIALSNLEQDTAHYLDDLDLALILLANLHVLYARLSETERIRLLQILAKRIIVNPKGEIIDHELHTPFMYLAQLAGDLTTLISEETGSSHIRWGSSSEFPLEPSTIAVEQFLEMLRFPQRGKLQKLVTTEDVSNLLDS